MQTNENLLLALDVLAKTFDTNKILSTTGKVSIPVNMLYQIGQVTEHAARHIRELEEKS